MPELKPMQAILRNPIRWLSYLFFLMALLFAAVAGIQGDVFFFRLATEALILVASHCRLMYCSGVRAYCHSVRRFFLGLVRMYLHWYSKTSRRRSGWLLR